MRDVVDNPEDAKRRNRIDNDIVIAESDMRRVLRQKDALEMDRKRLELERKRLEVRFEELEVQKKKIEKEVFYQGTELQRLKKLRNATMA